MPMMVGHSQGGIQLVKVLHDLAGDGVAQIPVWNPHTDAAEPRVTIVDPFTGAERPVVGLKIGYASVVGSGGAALMLPNQWSMVRRLRTIPDTVDDFTGYALGVDLVAWDMPGAGTRYQAQGSARVRNVELPAEYSHVFVAADLAPGARRGDARLAQRLPARPAPRCRRRRPAPPTTACGRPTSGSTSRSTGCWKRRRWCARGASWPCARRRSNRPA